ncbi:MAG TPA: LpqB family beta-propeller domain-containing protein [Pseudonocardiaceae bacterium]|jgi:hypothetical protein|nr:LpqB family beta-propeller domain-containing protein [Pseudonocardiaceae bacterium]
MSGRSRVLVLLVAMVCLTGCAAIPTQSQPKPIGAPTARQSAVSAPEPNNDSDPLMLVRDFVNASANPDGDYAVAKAYLTDDAKKKWDTKAPPTVIERDFGTVPGTPTDSSSDQDKKRTVMLQGRNVGRLHPNDNAFVPMIGDLVTPIRVEKRDDGQWRISEPPNGVYVTATGFNTYYQRVTLYFYTPDFTVLVPDARYVVSPPTTSIPRRVTDLLVGGPSEGMRGAVVSALGKTAERRNAVQEADDGALEVDLAKLGDLTPQTRKQIVAQVVKSLAGVTSSRIRVKVDGVVIATEQTDWRPSDVQTGEALVTPNADQRGLVVSGGQLRSLADGTQIRGPAGTGEYNAVSAAQSLDGSELAVVSKPEQRGVRLRVGQVDQSLREVDLSAGSLTRPTWLLSGAPDKPSDEVWTVADGTNVVRVSKTGAGTWTANSVNATALAPLGGQITELRLSRDGTRVAAVVGGKLVVAAVVRNQDSSVALRIPMTLQLASLNSSVLSVDWLSQEVLVVTSSLPGQAISKVYVDGFKVERYGTSNLSLPVSGVAAAPSRPVVVADRNGLWTASDIAEVWRGAQFKAEPGAVVFYPG